LKQLREKLKDRNESNAKKQVLKDIKMIEIQKKKEENIKKANLELS